MPRAPSRRRLKRRPATPDDDRVCTFCGQRALESGPLVTGPLAIALCGTCIERCCAELGWRVVKPVGARAPGSRGRRCLFCGRRRTGRSDWIDGPHGTGLCGGCVRRCVGLLERVNRG